MKILASVIRWTARILSLGMLAMLVVFAIGEGMFNPLELTPDEQGMMAGLALMVIGALLAWKQEPIGGLLTLGGFGLFWYLEGRWPGQYFAIFPLAGFLYLIAFMLEHQPQAKAKSAARKPVRKKAKATR